MSLSNTTVKAIYTGNGSNTDFSIPFDILYSASNEVQVYTRDDSNPASVSETLQVITTDYTLVGSPIDTVRFNVAPASGIKVVVVRKLDLTQLTDFLATAKFPVETCELQLDNAVGLSQQLNEILSRSVKVPVSTPVSFDTELPPELTATHFLRINSAGNGFELSAGTQSDIVNADINASAGIEYSKMEALTANRALATDASGEPTPSAVTDAELAHVSGVTGAIQTQLDSKLGDFTGSADNRIVRTDGAGGDAVQESGVTIDDSDNITGVNSINTITATEISYLDDVSSNIQTQLDAKLDDFSSTTDNALVRTDGTSGNAVQDTGITVSDTDDVVFPATTQHEEEVIVKEIATPSAPAAGYQAIFADTSDNKIKRINSSGEVLDLGGGAGGGFNLETDPYAQLSEDGSTGSWIGYDDAAADAVDLTGGTFDTTFANENSDTTILSGDYAGNFLWTLDAADRQGEGIAKTYTIPPALRGKAVSVSGRYATDVATSNGDFGVYVYDVTNTELTNIYGLTDNNLGGLSAGGIGKFSFVFYTANDTASVRIGFHRKVTDATATEFRFSDLKVSDQSIVDAPIVSGWQDFTPTISWVSNTTATGKYRRVGSDMELQWNILLTGTPSSTELDLQLPSGFTVDLTSVPNFSNFATQLGNASVLDNGTKLYDGHLVPISATQFRVYANDFQVTPVNPFTFVSGDIVSVTAKIPIAEWSGSSSGGVISTRALMNENVDVRANQNGNTSITANTTNIDFSNEVEDSHASFNGTQFTAPYTGKFIISGSVFLGSAADIVLFSYIDGSSDKAIANTGNSVTNHHFKWQGYLQKGQIWSLRSSGSVTLSSSTNSHWIDIGGVPNLTVYAPYSEHEVLSAESSAWTGTGTNSADIYGQLTGNKLTLSPGTWKLTGSGVFSNSGVSPGYAAAFLRWTTANGANTVTNPGLFSFDHGRDGGCSGGNYLSGATYFELLASNGIVTVTSQTDIYLVPIVNASTLSNARVTTFLEAQRLR